MSKGKVIELDVIKFYGIILVVLGHIAITYTPMSLIDPKTASDFMVLLEEVIYTFHMPMFIFVSGCVFAYQLEYKKASFSFLQLFRKKVRRLIIPFYAFGFLWVLPVMVLLGFRNPLHYAIDGFILSIDPRHLWYVIVLFYSYFLLYGGRYLLNRVGLPVWTIVLVALVLYAFPVELPYFQIANTQKYFLWFALGYVFMMYGFKVLLISMGCVGLLGALQVNLFSSACLLYTLNGRQLFFALLGIALCYVLSYKTKFITETSLYKVISFNSFGIYLFHAMIIYCLEFAFSGYALSPVLLSSFIFVLTMLLSVVLTQIVRRLGLGVLIGEK